MLAEYPSVADTANAITLMRLSAAWMRRKQFEAKLIAVEVGKMLFAQPETDRVSEEEMLRMLGITPVMGTLDG